MVDCKFPSLFEHFASSAITSGLLAQQTNFTLNDKPINIYSGALHYFRVHPAYWRDRLRKIRAAGLNTVETYVPWNLHEPEVGLYDFGNAKTEFEEFLDIATFIKLAQEEDLFVIVRPGPYICAELEFGGLPSWLLRGEIKIRTSDAKFIELVEKYFKKLLAILTPLQFTKGGPIIAFQIENEYGNTKIENDPIDVGYLEILKNILLQNGVVELLFTSDTPSNGFSGTLPGILATANFQEEPIKELTLLKEFQPNKPLMVMEYWTGWFDHWSEKHHTRSADKFAQVLEEIIKFNSSFNLYMFHGGTNWGLLNGANVKDSRSTDNASFQPDTTSYDYDAPLSEAGDYTDKYYKLKQLITKYSNLQLHQPPLPELIKRVAYPPINISAQLSLDQLISQSRNTLESSSLLPMELLDINNKSGQSYGYLVYRKKHLNIAANSTIKIEGRVCDTVLVLINGEIKSKILQSQSDLNDFGYWRVKDSTLHLGAKEYKNATLDLVVENWGRVNYGKLFQFNQHKGLWQGNVLLNHEVLMDWTLVPLEFKKSWTKGLVGWEEPLFDSGPALYKATFDLSDLRDTYIDLREWNKGIVVVNGFVLARYLKLGPQQFAYLPAPLLKKGANEIVIFEHFAAAKTIKFAADPIFETL